jgi:hypothetical protein
MVGPLRNHIWILLACVTLVACRGDDETSAENTEAPTANSAPEIAGEPTTTASVGLRYEFIPEATDPEGDTLTFGIANRPSWASFSALTGRLSGTPSPDAKRRYEDIQVSVTDGTSTVSLPTFDLVIEGTEVSNSAPTITGTPAAHVVVGNAWTFTPQATDADGDTLTYAISNKPAWLQFNTTSGRLFGTPSTEEIGTYAAITISVSDGTATRSLEAFSIEVRPGAAEPPVNTAPTISGQPAPAITAGNNYQFLPAASDADGQALTFAVSGKPAWAAFNTATGRLSGTPSSLHVGEYVGIRISVSDGTAAAALPEFSITVLPSNAPPQIGGVPPARVTAGETYIFQPSASDADGQSLTFTIAGKPAWATFNSGTGRLAGTPTGAQTGLYGNIAITVSDGVAQATLGPFSIEVVAANRAPVINGTPATTVDAGQPYDFRPAASDPDGDALTFSIANKPVWATFSTSTGRLSGTPTANHAGTYASVLITASDGELSATLPAFSIEVRDVASGSATLSWVAPTRNEDGTTLTNLQGYRVYYGLGPTTLGSRLEIPDPSITSATVEELTPGTWYFAVTAYASDGNESERSAVASKTID